MTMMMMTPMIIYVEYGDEDTFRVSVVWKLQNTAFILEPSEPLTIQIAFNVWPILFRSSQLDGSPIIIGSSFILRPLIKISMIKNPNLLKSTIPNIPQETCRKKPGGSFLQRHFHGVINSSILIVKQIIVHIWVILFDLRKLSVQKLNFILQIFVFDFKKPDSSVKCIVFLL